MKRGDMCIVTWGDAWATHEYYHAKDDHDPMPMQDIGWFMEANDETIVLARSRTESESSYRAVSVIPWVNVITLEVLVDESE